MLLSGLEAIDIRIKIEQLQALQRCECVKRPTVSDVRTIFRQAILPFPIRKYLLIAAKKAALPPEQLDLLLFSFMNNEDPASCSLSNHP